MVILANVATLELNSVLVDKFTDVINNYSLSLSLQPHDLLTQRP